MYIGYEQGSVGGKQVAELMHDIQSCAARLKDVGGWIAAIHTSTALETNTDFGVADGQASAFNDTFMQIKAAFDDFMDTDGNREKIERLARGA